MTDRFMIRPIGALDLDRAARLHRDAFAALGERPWTRQDMAELLASSQAGGFFLLSDGADAGIALWRVIVDEAELLTVAVHVDHRRRGVGRALLDAVIERVRERGAHKLFLEVGVDNPPALSLYAQAGFTEVGRRVGYYQRHHGVADALILRLLLNDAG
jgi:ribosomal-protein-alanine N-acetyltransferase